jgi:hypothetical protein
MSFFHCMIARRRDMVQTRTVAGVSVAVVALAAAYATWRSAPTATSTVPSPTAHAPVAAPSPPPNASDTPVHFRPLLGEWLRPDGGYVLVVRGIRDDGEAAVTYLNPRPIRVARAEARRKGDVVSLFVEFDDVNYRGSTYSLDFNADRGQLEGLYFQATLRQQFDVAFVRPR